MVTIYNFKVRKIHLFFLSLLPMIRLITSLLGRSQSHIEYLTITGVMQIFVLNLNVDDLAFCIAFTCVWNLAYFLMISWWKMNSRTNAHTDRLHRNSMSALFSRCFREAAYPHQGYWRQTPHPYFPMGTLLFGILQQEKTTNRFFRILKIIVVT